MTDTLHDPELDRLVRSLNKDSPDTPRSPEVDSDRPLSDLIVSDGDEATTASAPIGGFVAARRLQQPQMSDVVNDSRLGRLLQLMVERGASDLLLLCATPPVLRIDSRLVRVDGTEPTEETMGEMFLGRLDARARESLETRGAADFTLRMAAIEAGKSRPWRFRINLHRQRGQLAAAIRALPTRIPSLEELSLPRSLAGLVDVPHGLVLSCGPTGSGKSSTLAALVGEINRTRSTHIITIEDPLEYEHEHDKSFVEHIQIGQDAPSYAEALRAALRQDPDVILVGEMRDLETMATALTAAETGHLILSTIHTNDVVQATHRIVDSFPAASQSQIRQQLALSLTSMISQRLVPRIGGGRVPAVEVMVATYAVRRHIREAQIDKLFNEITLGQRHGMISLESSLARLVRDGAIELEDARARSVRPEELESLLQVT